MANQYVCAYFKSDKSFVSAPRGFSPGTPVFPSPQKPTFPNSNSSMESVPN